MSKKFWLHGGKVADVLQHTWQDVDLLIEGDRIVRWAPRLAESSIESQKQTEDAGAGVIQAGPHEDARQGAGSEKPAQILAEEGKHKDACIPAKMPADEDAFSDEEEDIPVIDVLGKWLIPGMIDSHIHIESSMLRPAAFARAAIAHGTTAVIADPHEIANVAGQKGLDWMLEDAKESCIDVFYALPSCVPANNYEETGAALHAADLKPYYDNPLVVALGEVMNVPGVLQKDADLMEKIADAKAAGRKINGHAPLLAGADLQAYIDAGISDDHECGSLEEALEKQARGMHVFIREGTAAKNMEALQGLFSHAGKDQCMLAVDDLHPQDLAGKGHLDVLLAKAMSLGADFMDVLPMATWNPARYYGLHQRGILEPGCLADLVVLDHLEDVQVEAVFKDGYMAYVRPGSLLESSVPASLQSRSLTAADKADHPEAQPDLPAIPKALVEIFHMEPVTAEDFQIPVQGTHTARVIGIHADSLLTDALVQRVDFDRNNGIDVQQDRIKIAAFERHKHTGHHFTGLIANTGLVQGAVASSIGHDSHNLIVMGCKETDMALAANTVIEMEGGLAVVKNGQILASMALPIAGLMSVKEAKQAAAENEAVVQALASLQKPPVKELLMTMAFMTLSVIPHLKLTPQSLVDGDTMERVGLLVDADLK